MPSTNRTQLQRVHITSECVRALSARKRTPRSRSPFETPVATTITSPGARSSIVNSRSRSSTPATRADVEGAYDLVAAGATPVIDTVFPLAEARAAHERLEAGEQFGKILLEV